MTDEPRTAGEAAEFLARRKEQLEQQADTFPREAYEEALRGCHEMIVTLTQERDHYRTGEWKLGRLLSVLVHEAGDELDISLAAQEELGDLMLEFEYDEAAVAVTVKLGPAPPASEEGKQQQGGPQ